jgi:hypothetical protein
MTRHLDCETQGDLRLENSTAPDDVDAGTREMHPRLERLRAFWQGRCTPGRLPSRGDFSARALKPWLPNVAIIGVEGSPPRFKIRLMGTACVRYAQADYTGRYVDECAEPEDRESWLAPYRACVAGKQPVWRNGIHAGEDFSGLTTQRLYLPLAQDGVDVDFILACVVRMEDSGRLRAAR